MIVCRKCGWEIKEDFGMWSDMYEGLVCDWVEDEPQAHEPRRNIGTTNKQQPHLAVA